LKIGRKTDKNEVAVAERATENAGVQNHAAPIKASMESRAIAYIVHNHINM